MTNHFEVFLVLAFFVVCLSQAPAPGTPLWVTSSNGINVRAEPCTNGRLITALPFGAQVTSVGQHSTGCGYTWFRIRGGFGDAWGASNWLSAQNPGGQNLVYGPGLVGLDGPLISKLNDLGRLLGNRRVRVHSGCRPGDRGWHGKCKAADFHVDGMRDIDVYTHAFANRRQFDRFFFVYHAPGGRACTTGEHNHLDRRDNYPFQTMCHERTCNWNAECNTIRVGFTAADNATFAKVNENSTIFAMDD